MDSNVQRGRGRASVRGEGGGVGRRGRARQRKVTSDEIRATVTDHVLVLGRKMREAGQRSIQLNTTVKLHDSVKYGNQEWIYCTLQYSTNITIFLVTHSV